jgi:hypothetical protein
MVSRVAILTLLAVILMPQPGALASDANGLFWYFQRTGFSSNGTQTAVAMGDSKAWPVVFSLSSGTANTYTLKPVRNGTTGGFWHSIGTNLALGNGKLSAKSSVDGRVAVSVNTGEVGGGTAAVGRRSSGFTAITDVADVAFDSSGSLITASTAMPVQGYASPSIVRSLAMSPFGDVGLLQGNPYPYVASTLSYHEKNPMLGWQFTEITSGTLYGGDLAIDTIGRPFATYSFFGGSSFGPSNFGVAASYFDIMSGQWSHRTLATGLQYPVMPTIAADGIGGVGVAWMSDTPGSKSLMYAYKNGSKDWSVHTITAQSVTSGTSSGQLIAQERVGLDFDAENYPVVSFLGRNGFGQNDIWIAYDPIVVPEPSAVVLAAVGFLGMCYAARRKRGQ